MKKYLSTMFLVTAITLTLSGCNDYEDKQREYDYANKMEQQRIESMQMEQEEQLSAIEETNISYTFESDSQEVYESLQNADAKIKEILEEETLSQRLINSGNEMSTEKAQHIDNLTNSVSTIISTYIEAIETGDKETCDKCNRALSTTYDLYNEIYDVTIGNKVPEENDTYLVGDIDHNNTILRGPYMSVFSDKNALTVTNWLAKMDEDIFDEYVVVENTSERADENTSYIVDVTDYNERIADQLLTIKEDYSDIYGFNPEDVEIRWIGSDEEGSFGFIDKDTKEPFGLVDGLTNNKVNSIVSDQENLENRTINVDTYEQLLQQEKSMEAHTKRI
ncbi:MAG: hypothetical protein IIZ67_04280 [Bacilli bacterium]|nr:hypothetical protein [Bacilli bacterium]